MNWFEYRQNLANGKTVQIRPEGEIYSGKLVTFSPIDSEPLKKNDVIFCDASNEFKVCRIQAVRPTYGRGYQYQVGTKDQTFGELGIQHIHGIATKVE